MLWIQYPAFPSILRCGKHWFGKYDHYCRQAIRMYHQLFACKKGSCWVKSLTVWNSSLPAIMSSQLERNLVMNVLSPTPAASYQQTISSLTVACIEIVVIYPTVSSISDSLLASVTSLVLPTHNPRSQSICFNCSRPSFHDVLQDCRSGKLEQDRLTSHWFWGSEDTKSVSRFNTIKLWTPDAVWHDIIPKSDEDLLHLSWSPTDRVTDAFIAPRASPSFIAISSSLTIPGLASDWLSFSN